MIEPLPKTPRSRLEPDQETARLYTEYHAKILRYCVGQLRSREEAEDAVQNTFMRVCTALRKGVVPEFEGPWLYKIAHNVCLSKRLGSSRRARVETPSDLDVLGEKAAAYSPDADELFGLGEALADMPANLRRPLLMREWQGMSYMEIADALGVSHSAVETLIFRARRHLAQVLGDSVKKTGRAVASVFNLRWLFDALRGLGSGVGTTGLAAGAAGLVVAIGSGVGIDLATHGASASRNAAAPPAASVATGTPIAATGFSSAASGREAAMRGRPGDVAKTAETTGAAARKQRGTPPSPGRSAPPTGSGGSGASGSGAAASAGSSSQAGGSSSSTSSHAKGSRAAGAGHSLHGAPKPTKPSPPGIPSPSVPDPGSIVPPVAPPLPPLPPLPPVPAPPVIEVPGNLVAEATGALGAVVAYTVTATDAVDGAVPVTCAPASGSTFALGHTTVSCSSSDKDGNTSRASFDVQVRDTTAPVLTVPADITVQTSLESGIKVTFSATATDRVDAAPKVACDPASGSLFSIKTTTVSCTATDSSGNTTSKSFHVTVDLIPALP